MSASTKLGDEFLRIPKLDVSGTNWVIFKDRFIWALDARGILDHIDGTGTEPSDPISSEERGKEGFKTTAEHVKLEIEWKKDVREWRQGEAVAKQQIASSIPDSLFMKVRAKGTAYDIWTELGKHFEKRSRMVSIDLRRRLQEVRCAEKGNVVDHFATLRTMREDLASMGESLSETDFYAIIMGSLSASYDSYISALNATSSVLGTTLSADDLMLTLTDEYERRTLKSKGGKKEDNAAFYSNDAEKGRKGGSNSKKNVECHNCKKKGHYKSDCWAKGGGKEGQGPNQKGKGKGKEKDAATVAQEKKEDKPKDGKPKDEEAWMTMVLGEDFDIECSEVEETPCDESDNSYAEAYSCFIEDEALITSPSVPDFDIPDLIDDVDEATIADQILDTIEIRTGYEYAYVVGADEVRNTEVDLYDSGATRHMSGFLRKFFNFVKIEPVPITAADKRTFQATGKGDMYIHIPNKDKPKSRILLKDVLYAPSMGVTLVSISKIAKAGSTVVFAEDFCRIYAKDKGVIGEIKVEGGLYRVYSPYSPAHMVGGYSADEKETMTVDELHRRLGHVSYERAKLLVKKGLIEGIELAAGGEVTVCESCESAKGERRLITKVREGERGAAVGDEVHSDLWGPAPVESVNHKRYYVSFTDDHSRYTTVYFLHTKDETFDSYRIYEAWLSTQQKAKIKCLRSDRGGEYLSDEFSAHLKKAGTVRKLTVHDTPEHNGVAERLNRTIMERYRQCSTIAICRSFCGQKQLRMPCTSRIGRGRALLETQHPMKYYMGASRMWGTFNRGAVRSEFIILGGRN
jgi:hypothetical protein